MIHKFAFLLATSVALAAVPQIARASCDGSACKSVSVAGNKFTNKDKDLKIHLTGCFLQANGTCAASAVIDVTIDPNSNKSIPPPASLGSNPKVDVKTAVFVGALTHPHVQTLPVAYSVMTTINNNTDVPVAVKYKDAEGSEFKKDVKERSSSSSFAIRMDPNSRANPIKWSATYNSKECALGVVIVSGDTGEINVTKCGQNGQQYGGRQQGCLGNYGKNGCPTKPQDIVEEETKLGQAEEALKNAVEAAKNAKNKQDAEKALKQAEEAKKRIGQHKKNLSEKESVPAERINYTTKLPKVYEERNPFDLVYDGLSGKFCPTGSKLQWDGSILSCQKGEIPSGGERPIPPATDIAPNDPNRR